MYDWLTSLMPAGVAFILAVQRWANPFLDQLFLTATYLGTATFLIPMVAFVFWCVDRRIGQNLAYLILVSDYINAFLKNTLRLPRPAGEGLRVLRPETSPGFPSGHAQEAVAVWGYLAAEIRRPLAWALACVIILLVSFSRIYIGVHFPHDVIGGLLLGIVILWIYLRVASALAAQWWGLPTRIQVILAVGIPLILWLAHPAEQVTMSGEVTLLYPSAAAARDMGFLMGISLGLIAERRWVRFQVQAPWWQRTLRFVLGSLIVVLFWQGPKLIIPEEVGHLLASVLRLLRYILTGIAAMWWAPWLFVRLGLAQSEPTLTDQRR